MMFILQIAAGVFLGGFALLFLLAVVGAAAEEAGR